MKNKILLFLVSLMAALWLFACRKDPPQTPRPDRCPWPDITTEGLNTFGCKINGKEWVPRVPPLSFTLYDKAMSFDEKKGLGYGYGNCSLVETGLGDRMFFDFGSTYFLPTIFHTSPDTTYLHTFSAWLRREYEYYDLDESQTLTSNRFEITKVDTVNNFVAGTFEFTLYNRHNPKDSLTVTDGRFDMLYYPQ